jgi:hypothetical protein
MAGKGQKGPRFARRDIPDAAPLGTAQTVGMKVLLVIASVLVGIVVVAGVMSGPSGVQAPRSVDTQQYPDHYNARLAAVAQLAYGASVHCVEGECSGEIRWAGHENGKTVVWECVRGTSWEGNPNACVIEQNGKLQLTRPESWDPDPCDNT